MFTTKFGDESHSHLVGGSLVSVAVELFQWIPGNNLADKLSRLA